MIFVPNPFFFFWFGKIQISVKGNNVRLTSLIHCCLDNTVLVVQLPKVLFFFWDCELSLPTYNRVKTQGHEHVCDYPGRKRKETYGTCITLYCSCYVLATVRFVGKVLVILLAATSKCRKWTFSPSRKKIYNKDAILS